MFPQVLRAGEWFLRSGIQNPEGGVARYYRLDSDRYQPVSTEITGYAASTLVFLHGLTGDARYLDRARAAACFLVRAWDTTAQSMPFEVAPAEYTYFFDCGIIVRGLLAVWRATAEPRFLDLARQVGDAMREFRAADGSYHPILRLTSREPLERDRLRWSRMPGCYQLKSAMAWWELWEATGEAEYRDLYLALLEESLVTAPDFLPGHPDPRKVVDRLHAFLYFLEGLLPVAAEPRCAAALSEGIGRVDSLAGELAPQFARTDVYAQLLRIRLHAGQSADASELARFAAESNDPRLDGGFYFGRSGSQWEPYINPVSTAFAIEAMTLAAGAISPQRQRLI